MTQPQHAQPSPSYDRSDAASPGDAPGRFVWYDLMTTDLPAAVRFYSRLFGWTTQEMSMGEAGSYTMLYAGETGVGGVVSLDASHGAPSHWMSYLTVDSVDAACDRISARGGAVCVPPTDIPGVGRFAVIEDPAGAYLSPFTSTSQRPPEPAGALGTFCWNELHTADPDGAVGFYATLCGWSAETFDMGPMGTYWLFKRNGENAGGMMQLPRDAGARPAWLPYVLVADVDASAALAVELGGELLVPPADVPETGRFAVVSDPTGATVALFRGSTE